MKHFLFALTLLVSGAFFAACGETTNASEDTSNEEITEETTQDAADQTVEEAAQVSETVSEKQGPEYTSAYQCPMHCKGSGSDQPGSCPVCGMEYVAKADLKTEATEATGSELVAPDAHEGHDH